MKYRKFGRTGFEVSEVGFGAWALGGDWGTVGEEEAVRTLKAAVDAGVNLVDTADVYGDGRSEQIVAKALKGKRDSVFVLTKAGRRLNPHTASGYNKQNLFAFVERSLKNLETDSLDLVQLHCPPREVYYMPEVFGVLDDLVCEGKIKHYGVSVEKVEEAIKAVEFPNVKSVQVIFNIFRQRPAERFFQIAEEKNVGIVARVPLASGLLTGRMTETTEFPENDHRNYNREGKAFDIGETFSGVDFETGLAAIRALNVVVPKDWALTDLALKWILMFDAVSTVIPGAKNETQALANSRASDLPLLSDSVMAAVKDIYNTHISKSVHQRW
jgi:aryl-alcohol dehydrogenase-like predicted oxidoreductase